MVWLSCNLGIKVQKVLGPFDPLCTILALKAGRPTEDLEALKVWGLDSVGKKGPYAAKAMMPFFPNAFKEIALQATYSSVQMKNNWISTLYCKSAFSSEHTA